MHNTFSGFRVASFGLLPGHHQTYAFIYNILKKKHTIIDKLPKLIALGNLSIIVWFFYIC